MHAVRPKCMTLPYVSQRKCYIILISCRNKREIPAAQNPPTLTRNYCFPSVIKQWQHNMRHTEKHRESLRFQIQSGFKPTA